MKTPCDRLEALLDTEPEAASALSTIARSLAEHAADCPACQRTLARNTELTRQLGELHADYRPAPDLLARVERALASPSAADLSTPSQARRSMSPRTSRRPLWLAALGGAAVAALVAVVVSSLGGERTKSGPPETPPPARQALAPSPLSPAQESPAAPEVLRVTHCVEGQAETPCERPAPLSTGVGERRVYRLSDLTLLTLEQQSEVALLEGRALRVTRGEARFDVTRQESLPPLTVTLPTGRVEVLGTELSVRANQALSVVEVLRGLVAVEPGEGTTPLGDRVKVHAGEAAWLLPGRAPVVRASTPSVEREERLSADLGFGTLRARRPGAKADADRPLRLTDHRVSIRLQGAFARTTVEEAFASDEPHELEGIYRFTLPPGAQVAELSLLVDGRWEEGAFVERDRADKIWAGVIRNATPVVKRREIIEYIWVPGPWRDPALLSFSQGNTFELRIFPIPARGERRVRIAYTESLPLVAGARRYTLPLPADGSNIRAERFGLDLLVGGRQRREDVRIENYELAVAPGDDLRFTSELRDFKPTGDLVVEVVDPDGAADLSAFGYGKVGDGSRAGWVALALRPSLAERADDRGPLDIAIIVDTSYGIQSARLERAAELVRGLVSHLGDGDRALVLACATTCRALGGFEHAGATLANDLGERVARLEPLGSTRLVASFAEAARLLEREGKAPERRRIVYVGDGIQSVGELDGARVGEAARAASGGVRVTSVVLGGEVDRVALNQLARTPGGSVVDAVAIGSVAATADLVARRQRGLPLSQVELELPVGLHAVAPEALGDLWPGEERFVTARIGGQEVVEGEVVLRGKMGDEPVERRWRIATDLAERAGHGFVPRLWAELRIADLSTRDDAASREEVVALSRDYHLLSRHTSLLVLESPAMARAFDVAPTRAVVTWNGDEAAQPSASELIGGKGGLAEEDMDDATEHAGAKAVMGGLLDDTNDQDPVKPTEVAANSASDTPAVGGSTRAGADSGRGPRASAALPLPERRFERVPPQGGEWVPMRKVWYKEAVIRSGPASRDTFGERILERRERALDEVPESRERTMLVVRALIRLDELERAQRLTERWLEKDRLDPEALTALADLALLRGDPERAEALLASAVEVDPRSGPRHLRLAGLYEVSARPALACEHHLSRALSLRGDTTAQAEALRCTSDRDRLLTGLAESARRRIERLADGTRASSRVSGPFSVDATWEGGDDLDVVVVDPEGRVMSWLGGGELEADGALERGRERLAFRGRQNGRWQILVVRRALTQAQEAGDPEARGTHGTLRINAHGTTRRIEFALGPETLSRGAAEIDVSARFRYEPVPR